MATRWGCGCIRLEQPTAGQVGQNTPGVTVTAANAAAVASTVFPGTLDNNYVQIQIANKTSVWVHVNFGVLGNGQTVRPATLADYPGYLDAFERVVDSTAVRMTPQSSYFEVTRDWAVALQNVYAGADAEDELRSLARASEDLLDGP